MTTLGNRFSVITKAFAVICICSLVCSLFSGCTLNLSGGDQGGNEISSQSSDVPVPNVEGLSLDNAKDLLNSAGFVYDVKEEASNENDNIVIRQYPESGQSVPKGSRVTIIVSKSLNNDVSSSKQTEKAAASSSKSTASQQTGVLVKNFVGKSIDEAKNYFESSGIVVQTVITEDATYSPMVVSAQSVEPGTYIEKGSTIVLSYWTVGRGGLQREVTMFMDVMTSSGNYVDSNGVAFGPAGVLNTNDKTCWGENASGIGRGEYLQFNNSSKVGVSACGIYNGFNESSDTFKQYGRLTQVTFQGDNSSDRFTFDVDPDNMNEQVFTFPRTISTKTLRVIITDATPGTRYPVTCISCVIPYYYY